MRVDQIIIHEDNHVIAVNKPAGLLTQGDISGKPSLLEKLKDHIKQRDNKPGNVYLGMVQRLDLPVSGVIIFAKTSKAAGRLSESIRNRRVTKLYVAVSSLSGKADCKSNNWVEHRHYLLRKRDKTVVVERPSERSQQAILQLKTLYSNHSHSFNLVRLITGRKHQIRAQLSHLGLPILGDKKYGSDELFSLETGIGLHAYYCEIKHPVKQENMKVFSDVPEEFLYCFDLEETRLIRSCIGKPKFL